jgi:hypothetical protein
MMQKTDFEELDVKVWTATAPFAFFYPKDENGMSIAEDGTSLEGLQRADYFLLYINRYQVEIRRRHEVMFVIEQLEPEHIIWIDEIPYVFIYDMQNVPPELFDLE